MDSTDQMRAVAASSASVIIDFFCDTDASNDSASCPSLTLISEFRSRVSTKATTLHESLRKAFLSGAVGHAPASPYLGRTKRLYEFVREGLGIRMHGSENHGLFSNGIGMDEVSIGQNISKIYEVRYDRPYFQCTFLTFCFRPYAMVICRTLSFRCLFEGVSHCRHRYIYHTKKDMASKLCISLGTSGSCTGVDMLYVKIYYKDGRIK